MQNKNRPQTHVTLKPIAREMAVRRGWLAGLSMAMVPGTALAGPSGGDVVAGAAAISRPDAGTTQIDQHSNSAIINWQQFSVGADEFVLFNQPSSSAVVLNRVIGGSMSEILGQMQANGQVFLVNPMGVLFGQGSRVDVGGLVATTLDISDADFQSGNYVFSGASTAGIHNRGTITADQGFVVLSADQVQNTGLIQAIGGNVVLASAGGLSLDIDGRGLISYQIDQAALSELAGIDNLGQIIADGGAIALHADVARQLAGTVINNEGQLQARGIAEGDGGEIYLTASGGDIAHSGTIDVSGARGGTTRLIASDHLETTKDSRTLAHGGDPLSGGFVELSGHESIRVRGEVNVAGGRLLLDPATFTIGNGSECSADICETFLESQLTRNDVDAVATDSVVLENLSDGEITSSGTFQLRLGIGEVSYGGVYTRGTGGGTITFQDVNDSINIGGDLKLIGGQASGSIAVGNLTGRTVEVATGGSILAGDIEASRGSVTLTAGTNLKTGTLTTGGSTFESSSADASLTLLAGGNVDVGTISTEARATGFSTINADARVKITAGSTLTVNGGITTSARANGSSGSSGTADAQGGVELSGTSVTTGTISTSANANQSGSNSRGSSRASIQVTSTSGATTTGSLIANALYTGGSGSSETPARPVLRGDITIQSATTVDVSGSIFASHTNNGPATNPDYSSQIKVTASNGGIDVGTSQISARGAIDLSSAGGTGIRTGGLQAENENISVVAAAGGITISGQLSGGTSTEDQLGNVKLDAAGALSLGNTSLTAESVILRSGATLNLGSNFAITATEGSVELDAKGALQAGNISTTDVGSNADVRISADGNLQVGTISATATGTGSVDDASAQVVLTAGRTGTGSLTAGAITSRATAAATGAANASVDLTAANAALTVNGDIDAKAVANGSGKNPSASVKLTTSTGNLQFRGIRADASNSTGGTANANVTVTGSGSGNISNNPATDGIIASADASGQNYDVTLTGAGSIDVGDITGELLTVNIPAALTLGNLDLAGQSLKFNGDLKAGDVITDSSLSINNTGGSITLGSVDSQGFVSLTAASGNLQLKDVDASGSLLLTASAGDLIADKLTATSTTTVTAQGNVLVNGDLNAGTSTVNVRTVGAGDITVQKVTGGPITIGGQSPSNQTGDIQTGSLTATGNLHVESEAGAVNVSGVSATAGSIVLVSAEGLTVGGDLTSTNNLIRVLAGNGDLSLGTLLAASNIDLDTSNGAIDLISATADSDNTFGGTLNIRALGTDASALPAAITASGALAGSSITLNAAGDIDLDALSSANNIVVTAGGNISASGNWTGGSDPSFDEIDVQSTGGGDITLQDLSAGDLFIGDLTSGQSTGDITLGNLTATDSVFVESSAGDLSIAGISPAGGLIDLHSETGAVSVGGDLVSNGSQIKLQSGAGDLTLANLQAQSGITLQTANGAISVAAADADTDNNGSGTLSIVSGGTDSDFIPAAVTASGALRGGSVSLTAAGDIGVTTIDSHNNIVITAGGDILASGNWIGGTATAFDDIDVQTTAGGSITLQDLSAGDLFVGDLNGAQSTGDISLGTLTATDAISVESSGGNLNITAINPAGGRIDLSTGLGSITVGGDITSTGNLIDIDAADGDLTLANLQALSGITLHARNGAVTLSSANADTDQTSSGNLSITAAGVDADSLPAGISASGILSGSTVSLTAAGDIATGVVNSLNNILVTAGGSVFASGNWSGGTATTFDDIDVQSLSGGNITLQDLSAGDIFIGDLASNQNTGDISLGRLTATDTVQVETNGGDLSVTSFGPVGGRIDLLSSIGTVNVGGDITSSGSSIDIEAGDGNLTLANLSALSGITLRTGNGAITLTSADADTDKINGGSLSITTNGVDTDTLPAAFTATGALKGSTITLTAAGDISVNTLSSLNNILVTAGGDISAIGNWTGGNASASDAIDVQTLNGGQITLKDLSAGDLFIGDFSSTQNTGDITLGTLTATDTVQIESNGGDIAITAINPAGGHIDIYSAVGSLSVGGDITSTGSSIDIEAATGDLNLAALSALSGITLKTGNGAISLTSARADTDQINGGSLAITAIGSGADTLPAAITASGALQGNAITLDAAGDISVNSLSSLNNILVTSGGDITATGNWTGGTATSFDAIDVQTLNGGHISLKDLSAGDLFIGDFASTQNTGDITLGTLTATDTVQIESNGGDIAITAINPAGGYIDIYSASGAISVGGDLISTGSLIDIEAANGDLSLANLSALSSIGLRTGNGDILVNSAHADTDQLNGGSLNITAAGLNGSSQPAAIRIGGGISGNTVFLAAPGDIAISTLDSLNNVSVTSGGDISATGHWTAGTATSFDEIDVQTTSGGSINLLNLSAGDLIIGDFSSTQNTGDITLGTLSATDSVLIESNGGNLSIAGINPVGGHIDLHTLVGSIQIGGDIQSLNNSIDIDAGNGDLVLGNLQALSGIFLRTDNGTIQVASANADTDRLNSGSLSFVAGGLDAGALPASIVSSGPLSGRFVTLDAAGDIQVGGITSLHNIFAIAGGAISATGDWSGGSSVSADSIDVQTVDGGSIQLQNLSAGDVFVGDQTFGHNTGDIVIGDVSATDAVDIESDSGRITTGTLSSSLSSIEVHTNNADISIGGAQAPNLVRLNAGSGTLSLGGLVQSNLIDMVAANVAGSLVDIHQLTGALTLNTGLISAPSIRLQTADALKVNGAIDAGSTGSVSLLSTNSSVTAGDVTAQDLSVTATQLQFGDLTLNGLLDLDASSGSIQLGQVTAGTVSLDASDQLNFLSLSATGNASLLAGSNINGGDLSAAALLVSAGQNLQLGGAAILANSADLDAQSIQLDGSQISTSTGGFTATATLNDLSAQNATANVAGDLSLRADLGNVVLSGASFAADDAIRVSAAQGLILSNAALSAGTDNASSDLIALQAATISNVGGQYSAAGSFSALAGQIRLNGSTISVGQDIGIHASIGSAELDNTSMIAGGDASLTAEQGLLLRGSDLQVGGNVYIEARGSGTSGALEANALELSAGSALLQGLNVDLSDSRITTTSGNLGIVTSGDLLADRSDIQSSAGIVLTADRLSVRNANLGAGSKASNGHLDLFASNLVDGDDAVLSGAGQLSVQAPTVSLARTSMTIGSGASIHASDNSLDLVQARIDAATLSASAATAMRVDNAQLTVDNHAQLLALGTGSSDGLAAAGLNLDAGSADLSGRQIDLIGSTVITRNGDLNLHATGGELALDSGSFDATGDLTARASASSTDTGEMVIAGSQLSATGTLALTADDSINDLGESTPLAAQLNGQKISLNAQQIDLAANGSLQAANSLSLASSTDLQVGGTLAATDIAVTALGITQLGNATATRQLNIDSNGNLQAGALNAPDLQVRSQTGALDLGALNAGSTGSVVLSAATTLSSGNIDTLNLQASAQALSFADVAIGGTLQLNASAGDVQAGTVSAGSVDLSASNNLSYTALGAAGDARLQAGQRLQGGAITAGNISLSAGDAISLSGALTGSQVNMDAGTSVSMANASATAGNLDIRATTLGTGDLDATGTVRLASAGAVAGTITTGNIRGNAGIQIGSVNSSDATGAVRTGALQSTAGGIDIETGAGIQIGGAVAATGVRLQAPGQTLTLSGDVSAPALAINVAALQSASSVNLHQSSGDFTLSATRIDAPNVQIRSQGALAINGAINAGANGSVSLLSDTSSILAQDIQAQALSLNAASLNLGALNLSGLADLDATAGDIVVTDIRAGAVDLTASGSIRYGNLNTGGSAVLLASQQITGGGITASSINLSGATGINLSGSLSAADQQIRSQNGAISLGALNAGSTGSVVINAATSLSSGNIDTLNLQASAQALSFADVAIGGALQLNASAGDLQAGTVNAGSVDLTASGSIRYSNLNTGGNAVLLAGQQITGGGITASSINLSGATGINLSGKLSAADQQIRSQNGAISLGTLNAGSTGSVVLSAATTLSSGNIDTLNLQASAQALSFADVAIGGALQLNASAGDLQAGTVSAGSVDLSASNNLTYTALSAAGDARLQAGQRLQGGAITAGNISLSADDAISLSGALTGSQVNLDAGTSVSMANASATAGNLDISGASISSTGPLSATGSASLRSTSGNISTADITATAVQLGASGAIDVSGARLEATGGALNLHAQAGNAVLAGATLVAANRIAAEAGTEGGEAFDLILTDASLSAPAIELRATGQVVNAGSTIRGDSYSVNAQVISMAGTDVEVTGQTSYTASNRIDLSGARIRSAGLTLSAGSALNLSNADVTTSQATTATATTLDLSNLVLSAGALSLNSLGDLAATGAQLRSIGAVRIISGGLLNLNGGQLSGSDALLQSSGNLNLGTADVGSLDARSDTGAISADTLTSTGQILLRTAGALEASQLTAQALDIQASSANLALLTATGSVNLQFGGDSSVGAVQASQGASISSTGNLSIGTLQGAGTSNLSAGNNLVSNSIRLGGANLTATAGNQLRIGAQSGGVILQAGNADLTGTNAIVLQNGSVSVNQLLARSTGIIALDSVQLAANQSLIQAGLANLGGSNTKANEGLLQLRNSQLQVSGLLELEAAGTVESLSGSNSTIQAGALGVRAGNRIDLRTTDLRTGTAAVPYGGDSTLLSQLRSRGVTGLPSSNSPNAVFQSGNSLALGNLQMDGGYLALRSNAMNFSGTIGASSPMFVNIRSANAAPIQIENAAFESTGLGLTASQLRAFANPVFAFGGSDYSSAIVVGKNGSVDLANTRSSLLFLSSDSVTGSDQIRTGGRVVAVAPVVISTATPPTPPPQNDEFEPSSSGNKEIEQPGDDEDDDQDDQGGNQTASKQSGSGTVDEETSSELALECS